MYIPLVEPASDPEWAFFDVGVAVAVGALGGLLRVGVCFGVVEAAVELGTGVDDADGGSGNPEATWAEIGAAVTWRPAVSIATQAIPATEATAANHRLILAKIRVFRALTSRAKPICSPIRRISGQSESPSCPYRR